MLTPRDQLLASHEEFQKLAQEHTQYAQRLDSLTQKRYLTEDEKLEEVRLKKLKLRLKDQMESIGASNGSIRSLNSCPDLARRSRQRVHTLKSTALVSAFFIGI